MEYQADVTKWSNDYILHQEWDSEKAKKIQKRECGVIIRWLEKLKFSDYHILEIGCGNGYVARLLCDYLSQSGTDFSYQATDIVPQCLQKTKKYLGVFKKDKRISCEMADVYQLDGRYKRNSQQIIISTGFASAAAYKKAVPQVASVLKPGGILICDFINHFSLPVIVGSFPQSINTMRRILRFMHEPASKYYHCGPFGIREFFSSHQLQLVDLVPVGFYANPLLGMFIKEENKA